MHRLLPHTLLRLSEHELLKARRLCGRRRVGVCFDEGEAPCSPLEVVSGTLHTVRIAARFGGAALRILRSEVQEDIGALDIEPRVRHQITCGKAVGPGE